MATSKYIDICMQPIPKKNLAEYKKLTKYIGKLLIKHGALSSSDYVSDDENAQKYSFPKAVKIGKGEVIIMAFAEFKSKSHRDKVFKLMEKDPAMDKIDMTPKFIDPKRAVIGGFSVVAAVK
ncbi:DUF1428 family protein [Bacteriovorax sp. PP10]|uniref:DUF1428 family protein n=1 Tax=Bacteriovorax antarcticus TaxID=3088717 RepID=A0ABU5VXM6_9BACT|nr:DUF1428 family protein [Bacteriovorax sp. PP10]MEA9357362.1 DUF1428 family protein [Bacteriovorax sp. PP10]